jgi:hypothetical protein
MRAAARVRRTHGGVAGIASLAVRTALGIGLLALVINDGGQLVSAQVKAQSVARAAATAGADTFYRTHRADQAKKDAIAAAAQTDPNTRVLSVDVDQKVGTVTVRVEKIAGTLVVQRIGFLEKYASQEASDSETRAA